MRFPAALDWIGALARRYCLPPGRIATEGLTKEVEDAERKLLGLVVRVAKSLAPLGVTADDVRELVERRLQERSVASQSEEPSRPPGS
jgi:hypothetical protein